MSVSLRQRMAAIEWLIVDVDGVLTAGAIVYGSSAAGDRSEIKAFHVRDGSGLKLWGKANKRWAVITGRSSPVVEVRALELGANRVFQGAADKSGPFEQLLREEGVTPAACCYIGDDVPDVPLLQRVGLAAAPADACPEARAASHYVAEAPGGCGAVREVIERILRCQGMWI